MQFPLNLMTINSFMLFIINEYIISNREISTLLCNNPESLFLFTADTSAVLINLVSDQFKISNIITYLDCLFPRKTALISQDTYNN